MMIFCEKQKAEFLLRDRRYFVCYFDSLRQAPIINCFSLGSSLKKLLAFKS